MLIVGSHIKKKPARVALESEAWQVLLKYKIENILKEGLIMGEQYKLHKLLITYGIGWKQDKYFNHKLL
jgi:hypothetical protein